MAQCLVHQGQPLGLGARGQANSGVCAGGPLSFPIEILRGLEIATGRRRPEGKPLSREERAEIMKKVGAASEKLVTGILTSDQKKRLNQIRLQQEGVGAFATPEVQKALNLTDKQKEACASIKRSAQSLLGLVDLRGLRDIQHESPGEFRLALVTAAIYRS